MKAGMAAAHHRVELLRCRSPGIEAVAADTTLAFGRHTHEQFGIGLIERGAQKSASGRGGVEASAGDLITVNPGEVHDGAPIGHGGRAWRMLYLDPAVLARATGDIAQEAPAPAAEFTRPALHDPVLASAFRRLFQTLTVADGHLDGLATDEALLQVLAGLLQRHPAGAAPQGPTPPGIARAMARMDDEPAAPASLASLGGGSGPEPLPIPARLRAGDRPDPACLPDAAAHPPGAPLDRLWRTAGGSGHRQRLL
ncbi:hypothetical protein Acidovoranil_31180 [Acidovorax sp. FG27]